MLLGFKKLQILLAHMNPHEVQCHQSDPMGQLSGHSTGSAFSDTFGDLGDFGGSSGLAAWAVQAVQVPAGLGQNTARRCQEGFYTCLKSKK